MTRFLFVGLLTTLHLVGYSQGFRDWESHDVIKFYERIDLDSYSLDEDGDEIDVIYVPTSVKSGLYEVELYKVSSKLYQVRGSNIYMLFRYPPYLYNFDEGVLDVSYSSGTFYENPN